MMLLALLPGLAFPAIAGWLLLDLLEGKTRVLWNGEKWTFAVLFGLTVGMFFAFIMSTVAKLPLTLTGFLAIFGGLIVILGIPWILRGEREAAAAARADQPLSPQTRRATMIGLIVLGGWVLVRVIAMAVDAMMTPSFFDDTTDNWNLRGKVFYFQQHYSIGVPWDPHPGVGSYPPTVSLAKAWLSTMGGGWNEALINSIHTVWFVCVLLLVYWTVRRMARREWAFLATIMLAALPLELIHGTNAYADVFVSAHVLAAVSLLFRALTGRREDAARWLRLAGLAIALLPFTKNEGWALYFPVVSFLACCSGIVLLRRGALSLKTAAWTALTALGVIACVAVPWIGFKVIHNLDFGNAKGIDLHLQWQQGVVLSVIVNTFLEGNWGLLFPLFFGLVVVRFRAAFRSPLLVLTACVFIPYVGQLFLYLFTGLSTEALLQTGYARGIIQLVPVIVTLTVLLLHDLFSREMKSE